MPAGENEGVSDVAHANDALASVVVAVVVAAAAAAEASFAVADALGRVHGGFLVLDTVNLLQQIAKAVYHLLLLQCLDRVSVAKKIFFKVEKMRWWIGCFI